MGTSDVVQVEMDAFDDEFDGHYLSRAVRMERRNGNSELWVDAEGRT